MRESTSYSNKSQKFETFDQESLKNEYSEIINSCSWGSFSKGDLPFQVVTRDYLNVKLWDIRSNKKSPVSSYRISDYLDDKLESMYKYDSIFDRFDVKTSSTGSFIMTGGYNDSFHLIETSSHKCITMKANADQIRYKSNEIVRTYQ